MTLDLPTTWRLAARIAAVAATVLIGACARAPLRLYDGAPRPSSDIASVAVPEALEIAAINGREIRGASGMMRGGELQLELLPGRYEMLVFYRQLWDRGGEHDTLRSDPVLFAFDAAGGHRYRLDYPRPARYVEAQALSLDFAGWIEDLDSGRRVESVASGVGFRKGLLAELTGDDRLVQSAGSGSASRAVAPIAPADGSVQGVVPATVPAGEGGARDWLLLMQGWWSQASAEERRAFLQWVGENSQRQTR